MSDNCLACDPTQKGTLFLPAHTCNETKQTVGQAAYDILSKPQAPQTVKDTEEEMLKNYVDSLIEAAMRGEKLYGQEDSFYVCVQTRRERLLSNVIRNQFYPRQTRPTPQYDLALYHYNPKDENLSFVWCIPDKETVQTISSPWYRCPKGEEQLCEFVKSFVSGTLI